MNKYLSLICLLLLLPLLSCRESKDNAPIRVGYLQNDLHHLPLFVALDQKMFTSAGLLVEVAGIFKAGPEQMSAFASGELDIGYVGQAPATAAFLNRVADIKFLAQVNLEGSALVVRKKSGIKTLSALQSKIIAIPGHATMQDFLLQEALTNANFNFENIKIIVLKPPEMIQALNNNNIDAFIAWQPYPALAEQQGGSILLSSEDICKDHPCCVLISDAAFSRKYPDKVDKIIQVHTRACQFIHKNTDLAITIAHRYTGMDKATIRRALTNIKYDPRLDKTKAVRFVDFLNHMRYIRAQQEPANIKTVFN